MPVTKRPVWCDCAHVGLVQRICVIVAQGRLKGEFKVKLFSVRPCSETDTRCCNEWGRPALRDIGAIQLRGTKAEGRRDSKGRPTARRFGCHLRNDLILREFGQHKALQIQPWIAAPRPNASRLVETIHRPQRPLEGVSSYL